MGNCKKKCPLKASSFTDEYTLGYCDGIEQGRRLEMNKQGYSMNEQGYLKSVQKIGITTTIIAFVIIVIAIIVTIL